MKPIPAIAVPTLARFRERRIRACRSADVRVLTYHGLIANKANGIIDRNFHTIEQFRAHLGYLRRFRVISPDEAANPNVWSRRLTVVITFDDGYKNNEIAAELLEAARLPWGLYVSTDVVGTASTIWTARLSMLILHGHASQVEVLGRCWRLSTPDERRVSFNAIRRTAKSLSQPKRVALMDELVEQFDSGEESRLIAEFPAFKMLNWSDLRSLSASGVTIGSHGVSHEVQHANQPDAVIEAELSESQTAISRQLGIDCTTLAYPNGDSTECSRQIASRLGYRTAFTTVDRAIRPQDLPLALPRLSARGDPVEFVRSLLRGHGSP